MLSDGTRPHSYADGGVDWAAHLEGLPLPTWIGDPSGGNVFANLAYRRLLGVVDFQSLAARGWANHIHVDDRERYMRAWDDFVQGRTARFKRIVRWIRPDNGQTQVFAVRAHKLFCGQLQGWIRTDQAEQALAKLAEMAYVHSRGA